MSKYRFAWVLTNVIRLKMPVPYAHPSGAVTWAMLDRKVCDAVVDAAS